MDASSSFFFLSFLLISNYLLVLHTIIFKILKSYSNALTICIIAPPVPGQQRGTRRESAGDLCMLTSLPSANMYGVAAVAWWWSFGPGIWAGTSSGFFHGIRAGTLSVTRCLRCPALQGSQQILAGDLSASKERVWPRSPLVPRYSGAGDANDRCINWSQNNIKVQVAVDLHG